MPEDKTPETKTPETKDTARNPNEVVFDPPLKFQGQTIDKVILRAPLVKDMREADRRAESDLDKEVIVIARVSGINEEDLDTLSWPQYKQLQDKYVSFFG